MQYDQVATQRSLLRMGSGKPARPVIPGVPLLMLLLATSRCLFPAGATQDDTMPEDGWYFWNTVTGEVQLDDPGGVARCSVSQLTSESTVSWSLIS